MINKNIKIVIGFLLVFSMFIFLKKITTIGNTSYMLVTSNADSGPGTLREAITNANDNALIQFDFSMINTTINLDSPLQVNKSIVIKGQKYITLKVNGNFRHIKLGKDIAEKTLEMSNIVIEGRNNSNVSNASLFGGGIESERIATSGDLFKDIEENKFKLILNDCEVINCDNPFSGGGISVQTLTLKNSKIENNKSEGNGGGVVAKFAMIEDSFISRNITTSSGGGMFFFKGSGNLGKLIMTRSEVSENIVNGTGYNGGFRAYNAEIKDSAIIGNKTGGGGAGFGVDHLDIENSTIANNVATGIGGMGGGINISLAWQQSSNNGTSIRMVNCTVTGNVADKGAGICLDDFIPSSTLSEVRGSIITNNFNINGNSNEIEYMNVANDLKGKIENNENYNIYTSINPVNIFDTTESLSWNSGGLKTKTVGKLDYNDGSTKNIKIKQYGDAHNKIPTGLEWTPKKDQRQADRHSLAFKDIGSYEIDSIKVIVGSSSGGNVFSDHIYGEPSELGQTNGTLINLTAVPLPGFKSDGFIYSGNDLNFFKYTDSTKRSAKIVLPPAGDPAYSGDIINIEAIFDAATDFNVAVSSAGAGIVKIASPDANISITTGTITAKTGQEILLFPEATGSDGFVKWEVTEGNLLAEDIINNRFIMPDTDVKIIGVFGNPTKSITLEVSGGVNSEIPGDVGAYIKNQIMTTNSAIPSVEVRIGAIPRTGYKFDHWEIIAPTILIFDTSKTNANFIMPNENVEIKAVFVPVINSSKFSLDFFINPINSGNVLVTNVTTGKNLINTNKDIVVGDQIKIKAKPIIGYEFDYFSYFLHGTEIKIGEDIYEFLMPNENITLVARFKEIIQTKHQIVIKSSVGGSASSSKLEAAANDSISIQAIPDSGFHFTNWTVISSNVNLGNPTNSSTTFYMPNEDVEIKANFLSNPLDQYSITVFPDGKGNILSSKTIANKGEKIQLTVTPDTGHKFVGYEILKGNFILHDYDNYFFMPDEDVQLKAKFAPIDYKLSVNINGNGTVKTIVNGVQATTANVGDLLIFEAVPDIDSKFDFFEYTIRSNTIKQNFSSISIFMPPADLQIDAFFSSNVKGINLDQDDFNFGSFKENEQSQNEQTFYISNMTQNKVTGLKANVVGKYAQYFLITQPLKTSLYEAPDQTSFTVKPLPFGFPSGVYYATVEVSGDNGEYATLQITFTIVANTIITIELDPNNHDFGLLKASDQPPNAKNIKIKNLSSNNVGALDVVLRGTNSKYFEITQPIKSSLNAKPDETTFTVKPLISGLGVGTYSATIEVRIDNNIEEIATVSFTIIPEDLREIALSPVLLDFGTFKLGSSSKAKNINITNISKFIVTGLNVTLEGPHANYFEITQPTLTSLSGQLDSTSFLVKPLMTGLLPGDYSTVIKVTGDHGAIAFAQAKFKIVSKTPIATPTTPTEPPIIITDNNYNKYEQNKSIDSSKSINVHKDTFLIQDINVNYTIDKDWHVIVELTPNQLKYLEKFENPIADFSQIKNAKKHSLLIPPSFFDKNGHKITMKMPNGFVVLNDSFINDPPKTENVLCTISNGSLIVSLTVNNKELSNYNYKNPLLVGASYKINYDLENKDSLVLYADNKNENKIIPRSWFKDNFVYAYVYNTGRFDVEHKISDQFSDTKNKWMEKPVAYTNSRLIAFGREKEIFDPDSNITRAEFIVMLMRMLNLDNISDSKLVFSDSDTIPKWASDDILKAQFLKIAMGNDKKAFKPNESITRQDMFVLAYRAMEVFNMIPSSDSSLDLSFDDWDLVSQYAKKPIKNLIDLDLVKGNKNKINPLDFATRGESVQFLYKILTLNNN